MAPVATAMSPTSRFESPSGVRSGSAGDEEREEATSGGQPPKARGYSFGCPVACPDDRWHRRRGRLVGGVPGARAAPAAPGGLRRWCYCHSTPWTLDQRLDLCAMEVDQANF